MRPSTPHPSRVTAEEGLRHLVTASKAILSVLETDRLLEVLMDRAIELTRANRGFLMLAGADGRLRLRARRDLHGGTRGDRDGDGSAISQSVAAEVFRTGTAILSENVLGDDTLRSRQSVLELRLTTVMCTPLVAQDRILGVLYVDSDQVRTAFDAGSLAVFQALGDLAAIALENARLYELATTDSKTALANAGLFRARLDAAIQAAEREGGEVALALLDLDRFKQINDSFGHPAGDHVLRGVAAILRRTVGADDLAARFGGEEFVVVIGPHATGCGELGTQLAERLRAAIAAEVFTLADGTQLRVTTSVGVATYPGPGIRDADALLAAADENLYAAKAAGRDCVIAAARAHPPCPAPAGVG